MIDTLWQDVKYAARSLRHTPGFTAAAIVTLALGMGANATIFTLLDAVLFKPLPVSRPDELLTVHENAPDAAPNALPDTAGGTGRYLRFSYPRFQLLQDAFVAAMIVGRLVTTLLAGVTSSDPITFIAVAVSLVTVALAASYIPARRASRIDPATALRTE
jgi:ABC-type antimicrobial peptide transport system permease subunit